jgi:hypothetical protein
MVDLIVLAIVVFAFGLVSRRLEGTVLTAPIVFVVAGIVFGPTGLGVVRFELDGHTVLLLGEIALAIVLFTDASSINLSALRQNEELPLRLLGVGMPLTIALGTVLATMLLTETEILGKARTDGLLRELEEQVPFDPVKAVGGELHLPPPLQDELSPRPVADPVADLVDDDGS